MSEPSGPLQHALVVALKGSAAVAALVGGRIYDAPPPAPAMPYVTIGEDQVIPQEGMAYDGADVTLTIHVWAGSRGFPGLPEAKRIAAAIVSSLGDGLSLADGFRLVDLVFDGSRYLREPDGVTSHAVLTFTALTEPA